jgi:thiamine biosynthesis lipoprotein
LRAAKACSIYRGVNPFPRRKFLLLSAGALSAGRTLVPGSVPELVRKQGVALGATVTFTAWGADRARVETALSEAFAELERVEAAMSLFRPESELSRLNREGALKNPGADLLRVLQMAMQLSAASNGAFDVTVQPLWELRRRAQQRGETLSESAIETARASVNWREVEISPECIRLKRAGMALTLNGIAQGFAADQALAVLQRHGIPHALLDTGEFSSMGRAAEGRAWRVGIQHPRKRDQFIASADLGGRCFATSGDYETAFRADFAEHHVFDPRTGHSPQELASVSVVAPTAMLADALSTTLMVTGVAAGQGLLRQFPGADALFVRKDGSVVTTAGFPAAA